MNIVYISSGYPLVYEYLDRAIKKVLQKEYQNYTIVHPKQLKNTQPFNNIKFPLFAFTLLGNRLSQQTIDFIKKNKIQLAVWLTEDPYYIDQTIKDIKHYDYIFTVDSGALKKYRSLGFTNVYHLPLGTDPTLFTKKQSDPHYNSDVLLVGYPYPLRVQLVEFLLKFGDFKITVIGKQWHNLLSKKLRTHPNLKVYNVWLEPEEIAKFYNGAKIVLNPHRSSSFSHNQNRENIKNESINNRTFDIAACGTFQLIEDVADLRRFFSEEEMISYANLKDCLEKIVFYLQEVEIRQRIAAKARTKVLNEHTFQHRIEEILHLVQQ